MASGGTGAGPGVIGLRSTTTVPPLPMRSRGVGAEGVGAVSAGSHFAHRGSSAPARVAGGGRFGFRASASEPSRLKNRNEPAVTAIKSPAAMATGTHDRAFARD